jgi:hypothetical protein
MAILPYMKQLPRDFYLFNYPVPAPVPVSEPVVEPVVPETIPELGTPVSPPAGVSIGDTPPSSPETGAMWLNPANNGLYVYTDPGVWTQIGTNW